MSEFTITVLRAGGQLQPVIVRDASFDAVWRQTLAFAQDAALNGCPLGDPLPPKWVEMRDGDGTLVARLMIDASLRPTR